MFDVGYYSEPTTTRAHHAVIMFICDLGDKNNQLPEPLLLFLPDGGLALKYRFGRDYVAINFDEEDDYLDNILVVHGENISCIDFSLKSFDDAINRVNTE